MVCRDAAMCRCGQPAQVRARKVAQGRAHISLRVFRGISVAKDIAKQVGLGWEEVGAGAHPSPQPVGHVCRACMARLNAVPRCASRCCPNALFSGAAVPCGCVCMHGVSSYVVVVVVCVCGGGGGD